MGGSSCFGSAISAAGQVTAYSSTSGDAVQQAFIYSKGVMDLITSRRLQAATLVGFACILLPLVARTPVALSGLGSVLLRRCPAFKWDVSGVAPRAANVS